MGAMVPETRHCRPPKVGAGSGTTDRAGARVGQRRAPSARWDQSPAAAEHTVLVIMRATT